MSGVCALFRTVVIYLTPESRSKKRHKAKHVCGLSNTVSMYVAMIKAYVVA